MLRTIKRVTRRDKIRNVAIKSEFNVESFMAAVVWTCNENE